MRNRITSWICIFAVLVGSACATSINNKFTGSVSSDWNTAGNWDQAVIPSFWNDGTDKGDLVYVNYVAARPEGCTISSGAHDIYALCMARYDNAHTDEEAILNCVSGSLTIKGWELKMGYSSSDPDSVLNVYNGFTLTQQASGGTTIGDYKDATINMYGGTFNHTGGPMYIGKNSSPGTLNLYSGVVTMSVWGSGHVNLALSPTAKINVGDGVMRLFGTNVGFLNDLVDANNIEPMPGYTLKITYNSTENYTYLQAQPSGPQASSPGPADGVDGVSLVNTALSWLPGANAVSHKVYFGTSGSNLTLFAEINEPTRSVALPTLDYSQEYFWRVDEVNSAAGVTEGDIWSFTAEDETVLIDATVDFSWDVGPANNRATGFLHSLSPTNPDINLINVLKPQLFRMSPTRGYGDTGDAFENYDRVHNELGADIHLVLSGSFRDTVGGWPGDNGSWTAWENYVGWIMDLAIGGDYVFQYDIWNEPNGEAFWNPDGTIEEKTQRFFEAWKRAWHIIKSRDSSAQIVGPSNSWFGPLSNRWFTVEEFLTFAKNNNVLPDILTWHTWDEDTIINDVDQVRTFMTNNGFYIDDIVINEYGGSAQHTKPGDAVWYFANMEEAGVNGGVRTCTIDPWGCSTCWNVSLTGLLAHPAGEPRSTWWTYKSYAEITGMSVEVVGDDTVNGIAAKDDDVHSVLRRPQAKVLLGKREGADSDYRVRLSNLDEVSYLVDDSDNVRVVVEHIPCSGWDPLGSPVLISDTIRSFSETINVVLPDFGVADAYVITLYHPDTYMANIDSLAIFISHWLDNNLVGQDCLGYPAGDVNHDCRVDLIDFSQIASYWQNN